MLFLFPNYFAIAIALFPFIYSITSDTEYFGGIDINMVQDHVHMLISIPPKYSVSEVIGYIKGKSAIAIAKQFGNKKRNFNGEQFWARGYAVSTVGFEEAVVKEYIKRDHKKDCVNTVGCI